MRRKRQNIGTRKKISNVDRVCGKEQENLKHVKKNMQRESMQQDTERWDW